MSQKVKKIDVAMDIKLKVPMVPNFLIEDSNVSDDSCRKYPLSDFPDSTLLDISKAWTNNLLARAQEMRKQKLTNVR